MLDVVVDLHLDCPSDHPPAVILDTVAIAGRVEPLDVEMRRRAIGVLRRDRGPDTDTSGLPRKGSIQDQRLPDIKNLGTWMLDAPSWPLPAELARKQVAAYRLCDPLRLGLREPAYEHWRWSGWSGWSFRLRGRWPCESGARFREAIAVDRALSRRAST
jgi:hypothetical protein